MIGGNITVQLQGSTSSKNATGERVKDWHNVIELTGFIDKLAGDSNYTSFDAKIKETTHIFICDYVPIPEGFAVGDVFIPFSEENARMIANSKRYDVLLIDNPMELNKHLEIYLKYTGGQG